MRIIKKFTIQYEFNGVNRENYIDDSKPEVTDKDIIETETAYVKEGNWFEDIDFCENIIISDIQIKIED